MKGRQIIYSAEELAFIKQRKTLSRAKLRAKFVKKFGRDEITVGHLHALCKRKGWKTGRTGCFTKGFTPHNKGKPMPYNPNSAATRFGKGHLPHNAKYAGHERVSKDGYVEISVNETNPHTGYERRHVLKHRWLWEQAHGPIPKGMALKCKGDRLNCDPSNWELVPRALLPRLAGRWTLGYDEAPTELKPTIMAAAKLSHELRKRRGRDSVSLKQGE